MLSPAITDVSAVRLSHSARSSFAWNVPVATDCYMLTPRMGIEDQQLRSSVARYSTWWCCAPHCHHAASSQSSPEVNHQSESRMREIRTSGSEGGGTELNRFSLPL